jgi:hypothetical protein
MKDKKLRNLVQISQFLNSGETTTDVKKLTLDQLVRVRILVRQFPKPRICGKDFIAEKSQVQDQNHLTVTETNAREW